MLEETKDFSYFYENVDDSNRLNESNRNLLGKTNDLRKIMYPKRSNDSILHLDLKEDEREESDPEEKKKQKQNEDMGARLMRSRNAIAKLNKQKKERLYA